MFEKVKDFYEEHENASDTIGVYLSVLTLACTVAVIGYKRGFSVGITDGMLRENQKLCEKIK